MFSKEQFTTVTPLSKALAMVVFIILPFAAFFLGMNYGKQTIRPIELIVIPRTDDAEQIDVPHTTEDVRNIPEGWLEHRNEELGFSFLKPSWGWNIGADEGELQLFKIETGMDFIGPDRYPDISVSATENGDNKTIKEFELHYLNGEYVNDQIIDERVIEGRRTVIYRTEVSRDIPEGFIEGRKIIVDAGDYFITLRGSIFFEDILDEMLNSLQF